MNKPNHDNGNWLDAISRIAFDRGSKPNSPNQRERRRKGYRAFRRILPIIGIFTMLLAFQFAGIYYSQTQKRMESGLHVTNLTKAGLQSRIKFGESPDCDGNPCWVTNEWNDTSWQTHALPLNPNKPIATLNNYDTGLKSGWMYYRFDIPIDDDLLNIKEEISFTPLFIQHKKYFVYLNGRLTFSSDGIALGRISNFPIPRSDINNGIAKFTVKASVKPEDLGIAHYHSVLVGPKPTLDQAYLFNQHSQYTYYLLFILSKGGIFVIFSLFFLYTRGQPGFLNFLVYAFFSTVENLFIGDFLFDDETMLSLNERVFAFYSCKAIAINALLAFMINFYQAPKLRKYGLVAGGILTAVTMGMAIDFGWGSKTATFNSMWSVINGGLTASILFSIGLGCLAIRRWRLFGAEGQQLKLFRNFTIFLAVYLLVIVDEFYFKVYVGFDKRALIDLFFFGALALMTARDMGLKEGRIKTLEGHMDEKRRMEEELQEAAEIAKAFMPSQTPVWKKIEIDAFHKPLTENSGDWFTFEHSPDGKLYHFVMCDITGHGVQAAIVVSTCKSVFSSLLRSQPEVVENKDFILHYADALNATLFENGAGYHVSTLLGLTFDPENEELHYITAGHPPPLQMSRRADDSWKLTPLVSRNNVLGVRREFAGKMQTVKYEKGDQLITYTDGLPVNSNIKALKRFLTEYKSGEKLTGIAAATLKEKIWAAEAARTSLEPDDDISIVWFKGVA